MDKVLTSIGGLMRENNTPSLRTALCVQTNMSFTTIYKQLFILKKIPTKSQTIFYAEFD